MKRWSTAGEAAAYEVGYIEGQADMVVRCKDCKYFVSDWWEKIGNISLIVAHEICQKWGGGCKTSPYGYCFLGERRKDE